MKLTHRLRRARANDFSRKLIQESCLKVSDLIYPIFIHDKKTNEAIDTMPGIFRHSFDSLINEAQKAYDLGIVCIALFPAINPKDKNATADEALNPKGLVPNAIYQLKSKLPSLGIIADVALDPYTSHGHDGLLNEKGEILNDETCEVLAKQSLILAESGCDIVAPSDMMDGRVGLIRDTLESHKFTNTLILSYAAKYASHFYGPFRDAVGSKVKASSGEKAKGVDKRSYQMDYHNSAEALAEVKLDLAEGADWLLIKPAITYLDVLYRVKQAFNKPTFCYQVSGEYAMLKFASVHQAIDYENALIESLVAFKRAGADGILSYGAIDAAKILLKR